MSKANWIRIEDSLPGDSQEVIVYEPGYNITYRARFHILDDAVGWFNGTNGRILKVEDGKITHWMNWPPPPGA